MSSQPKECFDIECPLAGVGTGFVLDSGDPKTARVALQLEAPGKDELIYEADDEEVQRRRERFPSLDVSFIRRGVPVVGRAGGILWGWGLAPVQITRRDVFVANTLRCLPPKIKDSPYPTGNVRKKAEACCRQWDRWDEYKPTVALVNIHPAAIAREPAPLPLMIKTFSKAKHFAAQGERPLVLCGGKAVKVWLGHSENVNTWVGHYESETPLIASNREKRREEGMKVSVGKKVKVKRLTAKSALEALLKNATPIIYEDHTEIEVSLRITEEEYKEMCALLIPKVKKVKEKRDVQS